MFQAPFGLEYDSVNLRSDARAARRAVETHRLRCAVRDYVYATPGLVALGDDPVATHLTAAAGFDADDLLVTRVSCKGRSFTAICVQRRVWHDAEARSALIRLRDEARSIGTKCILVPSRWVRGSKRGSVAKIIARARTVRYDKAQAGAVLSYVRAHRISALTDCCASIPDHPDPVGVVLALCAQGLLSIDTSRPPHSGSLVAAKE